MSAEHQAVADFDCGEQPPIGTEAAREAFDAPAHVAYLNCASLGPRLKCVTEAGHAAIDRMAAPWEVHSIDWFKDARTLRAAFARLIGAPADCVTLAPSVSYGIAVAARNIPVEHGQNIVLIDQEYPSNFYSWRRLARARGASVRSVQAKAGASLTEAIVAAIDRDTAVVAVANCRWTDGLLIDLRRVGEAVRRRGAALVVDASQSVGAYPLDVAEIQPDFLATVGYKWLLGPYGVGYLYVAERWHANGEPLEESWLHRAGSENFATLVDYTDEYRPGAERFGQGGAAQFYLLPMAIAALAQIQAWTPARINERLRAWTDELAARAEKLALVSPEPAQRAGHMIGLASKNELPPNLASALAERAVHVGLRGKCIRVAPHLHTQDQAIDLLIDALESAISMNDMSRAHGAVEQRDASDLYPPIEPYETGVLPVSGGHRLAYEICGNREGRPVVFLHGGPGAGCTPNHRRFFDPSAYRIVLFDQRGAGRSTPSASIEENTTAHLIADIESLRRHLNIARWVVFGGSWGSTLALAYAAAHPQACSALVLRGIWLCRPVDLRWWFEDIRLVYPEYWLAFAEHIPPAERGDLLDAYLRRLLDPEPDVHLPAAIAWEKYETSCERLMPPDPSEASPRHNVLSMPRIEAYYMRHAAFLRENELIEAVERFRNVPSVIVHGRYDMLCPVEGAVALAAAWPQATLSIVADAGHSAWEPGIQRELVAATDRFRELDD